MIDLDKQVGLENFPDVPDIEPKAFIQFSIQIGHAWAKTFQQMQDQLITMGKAMAEGQIRAQSDFVLWPPIVDEWNRLDRKRKGERGPDSHVPPRHPVFHNTPNFDRKEAIRNARTKQLSRPIGSQGCGFVWNRGRLGP